MELVTEPHEGQKLFCHECQERVDAVIVWYPAHGHRVHTCANCLKKAMLLMTTEVQNATLYLALLDKEV